MVSPLSRKHAKEHAPRLHALLTRCRHRPRAAMAVCISALTLFVLNFTGTPTSWGSWSIWSSCSSSCGNGISTRTHPCSGTCGSTCTNGATETEQQNCTVGMWLVRLDSMLYTNSLPGIPSYWGSSVFSPCSATCGTGTQYVSQTCLGNCNAACSVGSVQNNTASCSNGK